MPVRTFAVALLLAALPHVRAVLLEARIEEERECCTINEALQKSSLQLEEVAIKQEDPPRMKSHQSEKIKEEESAT